MNSCSIHSFWNSVDILIKKPHVVNKRLWGHKIVKRIRCNALNIDQLESLKSIKIRKVENIENFIQEVIGNTLLELNENGDIELILLELLPKSYGEKHAFQMVCLRKTEALITFYNVTPSEYDQSLCPPFGYTFYLQNNSIYVKSDSDENNKSMQWLNNVVLPQLVKWAQENANGYSRSICSESLALVSSDKYYEMYNNLKLKHGKELVKIWPECTDPLKFVYEDVAIATYLLLLWQSSSNTPQTFIDIGCGNGLLVYILTMEGHTGVGIDVRKRKIWELYPHNIILKEHTVTPPNVDIYSEADWIIGNHSDELTPWIPIIAAKSSYRCGFFLLPCCPFNFDGSKYQRQNSSLSQYTEYLDYIHDLCKRVGFNTEVDRLKIPSTKRICFVSKGRTYSEEEYEGYLKIINEYIFDQINCKDEDVKIRDPIEKVKNCTQINKDIIKLIIKNITDFLLNDIDIKSDWSSGKVVELSELIKILPPKSLISLKSECGGLQTLLRNNHQIFEVKNGMVKIKYPKTIDDVKMNTKKSKKAKTIKTQVQKCWFYNNHPQGCPLQTTTCSFLHEKL